MRNVQQGKPYEWFRKAYRKDLESLKNAVLGQDKEEVCGRKEGLKRFKKMEMFL